MSDDTGSLSTYFSLLADMNILNSQLSVTQPLTL